jgi:hypothetical protein
MERLLQTEVLEEIRDEINAELEARQNAKEAEQAPTNTGSPTCPMHVVNNTCAWFEDQQCDEVPCVRGHWSRRAGA